MTKRKCISTRILTRLLAVFLSFSPFMTLQAAAQQSPVPPFPRFGRRIVPALPHRSRLEPATEEQRVVETEITYKPIIHLSL